MSMVNCDLTGTIPNQIGRVGSLRVMSLGLNRINGTLPDELSRLHELTALDLSCNQLSGMIPEGVSKLRKIGTWKPASIVYMGMQFSLLHYQSVLA